MTQYLFIDGAFFESVFSPMLKHIFPDEDLFTAIDLRKLTQSYDRAFYYDALPAKKTSESDSDWQSRRDLKEALFNKLSLSPNLHVRSGISRYRRGRGTEQKGPRRRTRNGKTDGAGVMAFYVRAHLKTFFRWVVFKKEWMLADPTERLREISKPDERERVLTEDEIRRLWRACDRVGYPFGPALQLLLLTGQRKNEVAGLHRDELNMDKRQWTIPRHRTKNRRTHIVPLSQFAMEIIESLPRYESGFLFSEKGENPIKHFQYMKEDLDCLMNTDPHSLDPSGEHWVIHDLRRTATTGMAALEVREEVADKVLNHVGGKISGVKRIYNRFEYLNERREALEKWASYVRGLVDQRWSGVSQNVSPSKEANTLVEKVDV